MDRHSPFSSFAHALLCGLSFISTALLLPTTSRAEAPDAVASQQAVETLKAFLKVGRARQQPLSDQEFAHTSLTAGDAARAVEMLWADHVRGVRQQRSAEMRQQILRHQTRRMPFYYRVYGSEPANGRSLYISLHGGGGAAKHINDQQWENQKRLYRPLEGVYVAPRAPTDTWNLWHQPHIDPLFDRLIQNMIVFENVDANRVYLLGYSAGGDGVYQLAPRMADRWAAAAVMAGHPNDASPLALRNIGFTIHMGGLDSAYNRNRVAEQWKEKLEALQKAEPQSYRHLVKIYPDKGHWLDHEDAAAIPWMAKFQRNPLPRRIVWKQDDVAHQRFYWLAVDLEDHIGRAEFQATIEDQTIELQGQGAKSLKVRLNDKMLDLDQPLAIRLGDTELFRGVVPRTIDVMATTLAERGDPYSVFDAEVRFSMPDPPALGQP